MPLNCNCAKCFVTCNNCYQEGLGPSSMLVSRPYKDYAQTQQYSIDILLLYYVLLSCIIIQVMFVKSKQKFVYIHCPSKRLV